MKRTSIPVVVAALACAAVPAVAVEGGDDGRILAQDAFWYRQLPRDTPVAEDSDAVVADLVRQAEQHFGEPGRPHVMINTSDFAPTVYEAGPDDPLVDVGFDNCQDKPEDDLHVETLFDAPDAPLRQVRIPEGAVPAGGSDAEMVVVDAQEDTVLELWKASQDETGAWSACWGGVLDPAGSSDGVFEEPFGVTASGLSILEGTVRADELDAGRIDHVVGLALPFSAPAPQVSWPANRTDGVNPEGFEVPAQGQMLRLPADLDLDSMTLSPTARALAEAAQDHGLIVWDTAGTVSFRAENPRGMEADPYPEIFRGRGAAEELAGDPEKGEEPFPLDQLELLPVDYEAPAPESDGDGGVPGEGKTGLPVEVPLLVGAAVLGLAGVGLAVRSARRR